MKKLFIFIAAVLIWLLWTYLTLYSLLEPIRVPFEFLNDPTVRTYIQFGVCVGYLVCLNTLLIRIVKMLKN